MPSILRALRTLADPSRLRLFLLLEREELSVLELQEILSTGQSTISTHLSQLKQAGLVDDRRSGKNILYRLKADLDGHLLSLAREAAAEVPETANDIEALHLAMQRRQDRMRAYFDELAGKFGRHYVPGRSWKALTEMLLRLLPPMTIADLGAGEGTVSLLLAQRARHVIAVDNSEKMVEYGARVAREHGVANLEYRLGDLESLPIEDASVDIAFFSQSLHHAQHPERAVAEAYRIVKPGGRVALLDLVRHTFEEAREMYADLWLGFAEVDLRRYFDQAGFRNVETAVVHREAEAPHFQTVLAVADK
ncbi:MAG: metalloregulator ArsR/SmtB family transcription factor [Bryobacterales bacterium]|nr:metalloregulator ArsR/SmtB family transcription factor [Bryobacterales bacterium]